MPIGGQFWMPIDILRGALRSGDLWTSWICGWLCDFPNVVKRSFINLVGELGPFWHDSAVTCRHCSEWHR